jgi:TIR domain
VDRRILSGLDVILQHGASGDSAHACRGFDGLALAQPVRILVLGDGAGGAAAASSLATELETSITALSPSVRSVPTPCRGMHDALDCAATTDPHVRSTLVWIGDGGPPSPAGQTFASQWATTGAGAIPVLPSTTTNPDPALPPELRKGNPIYWSGSVLDVAPSLLPAVGIVPTGNRVFVSYRHEEGRPLAEAMFHLLSTARFDVFLDRFVLEPGVAFAEELEQELLDKSFVLVVESPDINGSTWIDHEISFAITNGLGLAAVNRDWTTTARKIGEKQRFRLGGSDAQDPQGGGPTILDPKVQTRLVEFVRAHHARALVRRREELARSLELLLLQENVDPAEIVEAIGGLDVSRGPGYSIDLHVRPPGVREFRTAGERADAGGRVGRVISPGAISVVRKADLEWLQKTGVRHRDLGDLVGAAREIAAGTP